MPCSSAPAEHIDGAESAISSFASVTKDCTNQAVTITIAPTTDAVSVWTTLSENGSTTAKVYWGMPTEGTTIVDHPNDPNRNGGGTLTPYYVICHGPVGVPADYNAGTWKCEVPTGYTGAHVWGTFANFLVDLTYCPTSGGAGGGGGGGGGYPQPQCYGTNCRHYGNHQM